MPRPLRPQDGGTRLVSRWRLDYSDAPWSRLSNGLLTPPVEFFMERKMLLGIKARAERPTGMTGSIEATGPTGPTGQRAGRGLTQIGQNRFDSLPDGTRPLVGEIEQSAVQKAEESLARRPQQAALSRRQPHHDSSGGRPTGLVPAGPGAAAVGQHQRVDPLTVTSGQSKALATRHARPRTQRRHAQHPQALA